MTSLLAATPLFPIAHSGMLAALDPLGTTLVKVAVLSLLVLVLTLGLHNPRLYLYAGLVAYLVPTMQAQFVPALGTLYQVAGAGLMILHCLAAGRFPRWSILREGAFPAVLVYLMLGLLVLSGSVDTGTSVSSLVGVAVALVTAVFLVGSTDGETQQRVIRRTLIAYVIVSVVLVALVPGTGIQSVAFRWRGLASNPNTLGLITVFALMTLRKRNHVLIALIPAAIVVFGTGSRTAAIAMVLAVAPNVIERQKLTLRRLVLAGVILLSAPLVYAVFTSGSNDTPLDVTQGSITRIRNTRQESWSAAMKSIGENPLRGIGVGNDRTLTEEKLPVHSSILRPMVEVGLLGIVPVGMIAYTGWVAIRRGDQRMRPLYGALIVTGVFEGWLFAGGSVTFVVFLVAAYGVTQPRELEAEGDQHVSIDSMGGLSPADVRHAAR